MSSGRIVDLSVKGGQSVDGWLVGAAITSVLGGYFKGLNIFCLLEAQKTSCFLILSQETL